jgi:hypothetical protein
MGVRRKGIEKGNPPPSPWADSGPNARRALAPLPLFGPPPAQNSRAKLAHTADLAARTAPRASARRLVPTLFPQVGRLSHARVRLHLVGPKSSPFGLLNLEKLFFFPIFPFHKFIYTMI